MQPQASNGAAPSASSLADPARLAGAPISWGVCEVPGWGLMLPPERVLSEMASLGLRATELGAIGFLPQEPAAVRAALAAHGLRLVAGFVPVVLHERSFEVTRAAAEDAARLLAGAGAEVFVAAAVADFAWSPRVELGAAAWDRVAAHLAALEALVARHGLTLALHPHVGTLVETAADVEAVLARSDTGWCFDTGHLLVGGVDPTEFARRHGDRIVHVHLKDVDAGLAARLNTGELSLVEATQAGLFRPLGRGDAGIARALDLLDRSGYRGWLVLEQDTAITGAEPPVGRGPILDVKASIEFLQTVAPGRERERLS
ncbi:MAG TPA: TIM barrel protein [Solirubrobacteraceae bacterium]|nr:TIM barrel protein [Solirubrobacteraceae bacterium]